MISIFMFNAKCMRGFGRNLVEIVTKNGKGLTHGLCTFIFIF